MSTVTNVRYEEPTREKHNDTMTICTLARPDVITIPIGEYKEHVMRQAHYEMMLQTFLDALRLDSYGKLDIDFNGRDLILSRMKFIEPEAVSYRYKQLERAKMEKEAEA